MTPDEKFAITNGARKFWQSLNLYSPLETTIIIISFIAVIVIILTLINFTLSTFFGNLSPAWWDRSLM